MTAKKVKKVPQNGERTSRLNLRIKPELQVWIHEYARMTGKSISSIITDHFITLKERERGADVEQI
jgi:uncharacterized protein (DUF1778 family)